MKKPNREWLLTFFWVIAVSAVFSAARGDEGFDNPDDWNFVITPYAWLMNQEGSVTIKGSTSDVDTDIAENLQSFDIGGQFYAEARKGKWGIFTDTTYARSSTDSGNVDVEVEFLQSDFGVMYRFLNKPLGDYQPTSRVTRSLTLDGYLGGRYFYQNSETDIDIQPGFKIEVDETKDWVDPIVGARLMADLSDRWLFILRGDVGGFGINSNLIWSLSSYLGYELWKNRFLLMGYRVLDVDFEEGKGAERFEFDVRSHGPLLGLVFRF